MCGYSVRFAEPIRFVWVLRRSVQGKRTAARLFVVTPPDPGMGGAAQTGPAMIQPHIIAGTRFPIGVRDVEALFFAARKGGAASKRKYSVSDGDDANLYDFSVLLVYRKRTGRPAAMRQLEARARSQKWLRSARHQAPGRRSPPILSQNGYGLDQRIYIIRM